MRVEEEDAEERIDKAVVEVVVEVGPPSVTEGINPNASLVIVSVDFFLSFFFSGVLFFNDLPSASSSSSLFFIVTGLLKTIGLSVTTSPVESADKSLFLRGAYVRFTTGTRGREDESPEEAPNEEDVDDPDECEVTRAVSASSNPLLISLWAVQPSLASWSAR